MYLTLSTCNILIWKFKQAWESLFELILDACPRLDFEWLYIDLVIVHMNDPQRVHHIPVTGFSLNSINICMN